MGGTPSIEIRTLQQTRAKAARHVFRLPIVQKNCYKVRATTLEYSVQCPRLTIPAGNASPNASSRAWLMAIVRLTRKAARTVLQGILRKAQAKAAGRPKSMLRDCSRKLNRSASVSKSCKRKH